MRPDTGYLDLSTLLSFSHFLSLFFYLQCSWDILVAPKYTKKNLFLTHTILSLSYVHPLSHSLSFSHKLTRSFLPSMFLFMGRVIFWLFRNMQRNTSSPPWSQTNLQPCSLLTMVGQNTRRTCGL